MMLVLQDFRGERWKCYADPYPWGCRVAFLHQERNPAASCVDKEIDPFVFHPFLRDFHNTQSKGRPPAFCCPAAPGTGESFPVGQRTVQDMFPTLMLNPAAPSQHSGNAQADAKLV